MLKQSQRSLSNRLASSSPVLRQPDSSGQFGHVGTDVYSAIRTREALAGSQPDALLALIILAMLIIGVIMVQSASQFVIPADPGFIARREVLWAAIGVCVLGVTTYIDYHRWRIVARPGIIVAISLMAIVLKLGNQFGGAQRWLPLGPLSFQPSELAKLAFILFSADWLTDHPTMEQWRDIVPIGGVAALLTGLVILQNDLGTALIIGGSAIAMLFVAGAPLRRLVPSVVAALTLAALAIGLSPFRRARMLAFLHPLNCQLASTYHICQSLIAIGSGGIIGRGLGHSLEKTGYLPAPYTDSILAVIGEEFGLIGILFIILLIAGIFWRGMRIARAAPDAFGGYLAWGITTSLVIQAILNIGSSTAATPFTGVPLPFISYGGSSLVISLAAGGMVLNISTLSAKLRAMRRRID